ncbi:MAG: ABC transporter ATP-binding protein [Candidatus Rokuibacteriota bacterium]
MGEAVLAVRGLVKHFPVKRGVVVSQIVGHVRAVDGVSFSVGRGETFALVGESGCGKTTTARVILNLESPTEGTVHVLGREITGLRGRELRAHRASVQAVFQDPWSSLNPRKRVRAIVGEPLVVNRALPSGQIAARVAELLDQVGLAPQSGDLYPHEFSGGQRQRIAIARALALNPALVVLDEPVSALDVSIRAQIMNLLRDLQRRLGLTYLLIAHDLATVRYMATTVGVMYLGRLVEEAEAEELFTRPSHPYTRALLSAALPSHPDIKREEVILTGEVPSPLQVPPGCRFHTRCPVVLPKCSDIDPDDRQIVTGHRVACHLY